LFGLGVLALLVFVPLQMELSWLPSDAPPVVDPSLVVLLGFLAIIGICILAFLAYRALWGQGGWVDHAIVGHRTPSPRDERSSIRR
jgi:hypothetical protein